MLIDESLRCPQQALANSRRLMQILQADNLTSFTAFRNELIESN
jgi:hypothetical protein